MGVPANIAVQRSHAVTCAKLSAPINQTNLVSGQNFRIRCSVSAEYRVPSRTSRSLTLTRRSGRATCRAAATRSVYPAIPSAGFSGFCGETNHQISSRPSRRKASLLTCKWPAWAGLNEPPSSPIRRPCNSGLPSCRAVPDNRVTPEPGRYPERCIFGWSTVQPRPARAHAISPSKCRSLPPYRTHRRRQIEWRYCA